MANLSNIIKISQANYNTLSTQGSVTIGGVTYTYDSNALYVIEETGQVVPVSGTNDGTNWTTITIDGTTKNIPSGGGGGSGTVTSVGAGTGLSISGTATVNPTVNIASGYKLPTTTEWSNKSTVSGTTSGNNWSAININGTSKNIPQGTVTSARVQAGTGLSSSQSTSQSTTLDTTISIAAGYKLPTTSEWNAVSSRNRETFRNYTVSPSTPYFYLYDGSGNLIETIGDDISEAYNPNSPNWDILFEYFRQQVFKLGAYDMTGLPLWGPYAAAGLFTASDDGKNSFEALSPSVWMSTNLLSYFTAGDAITSTDIDSYKVEIIGPARSAAECTLKITVFTINANEYVLQICSRWVDSSGSNIDYITDGWHGAGTVTTVSTGTGLSINGVASINPIINIASGYKLPTTTEWSKWTNNGIHFCDTLSSVAGSATSGSYLSVRWYVSGIDGITEPYEGMKIWVKIPRAGVSTAGVVLSLNGNTNANYYPVVYNVNTVLTSHYAANSYKCFIFTTGNANTVNGYLTSGTATGFTSYWHAEADYDSTNVYQLRQNSSIWANKTGYASNRYTLLFEVDGGLSGAATTIATGTTKTTVTFKYIPGGNIFYYSTNGSIANNSNFSASGLYEQITLDLRYTFNIGTAVISSGKPVYVKCSVNSDGTISPVYSGSPSHPIVTALPSTEDGYVYLYLGRAYSTSSIELKPEHPIYEYKNGEIRLWTNVDIPSNITKYNSSDTTKAQNIRILTQAQYDALATKDSNTIYLIKG